VLPRKGEHKVQFLALICLQGCKTGAAAVAQIPPHQHAHNNQKHQTYSKEQGRRNTCGEQQRIQQCQYQHHGHGAEHADHGAHALLDNDCFIDVIELGKMQVDHHAQQGREQIEGRRHQHSQHQCKQLQL